LSHRPPGQPLGQAPRRAAPDRNPVVQGRRPARRVGSPRPEGRRRPGAGVVALGEGPRMMGEPGGEVAPRRAGVGRGLLVSPAPPRRSGQPRGSGHAPELPAEDAAELAHIHALHQQQQQADRQARRQQAEKDARKDGVLPVGEAVVRWKAAVEAAWYAGDPPPAVKPHLDAITTALNRAGEAIPAYPPARATWEQLDHEGTFQQCSSPFIQPYQQRPGGAVAWPEGERRACRLGYEHARRVVDMLLQGGDPTSAIELLL